jgi:transposase
MYCLPDVLYKHFIPDTLSKVIHQRGKRTHERVRIPKLVNNLAAGQNGAGEQLAAPEPRLVIPYPTRVTARSPTPASALEPSAERTSPHEGSGIRLRPSQVPQPMRRMKRMNTNWNETPYFAALDWAKEHHEVVVVDRLGTVVAAFRFGHSVEGWKQFDEHMQPFGKCPIAVETSTGMVVDQLLQRQYPVYPVNPFAAKRYRERKAPSGTKSDRHDAWSLADALRSDGHGWIALRAQDEATTTLRLLCRDEITLIEQRTALINQLQAALGAYYPLALESFDDWTKPFAWAFVKAFPTAEALTQAGKRKWEKFLHLHKLWRPNTADRLARWQTGQQLQASAAVVNAKSLLALSLVTVLQSLQSQIEVYRTRIREAFAQHPDHDIFGNLPGAKDKLAPRLLAELGSDREVFPDPDCLTCVAGASPVTWTSGKSRWVHVRWACNHVLRATVHLWADESRKTCPWAQAYYVAKRAKGHGHASALRCLGKRWLKILWRLWTNHAAYDEATHLASLQQHGSFIPGVLAASRQACK